MLGVTIDISPAATEAFLAEEGGSIAFSFAADAPRGDNPRMWVKWMHRNWMRASLTLGVPIAFIVDARTRVAWIGSPDEAEGPLVKVLDGAWNLEAAARAREEELAKGKVRERTKIYLAITEHCETNDFAGAVAAIDDGVMDDPELEREFAPQREGLSKLASAE